jgi:hypothetical protein
MCLKKNVYSRIFVKYTSLIFLMVFALINPAHAVRINFEDIPYIPIDPEWPQFYDVEVTDQYLSKGLLIEGGYLGRRYPLEDNLANPQLLFGSNFMRMTFVGERLPNYVAMTVSSVFDYANIINFYGPEGHLFEMVTSGYSGMDSKKPYRPDQPISFTSRTGISEITFEGYFGMRWGTMVDNLYFKSSPQKVVPEPPTLLLFSMGLLLVILFRLKVSVLPKNRAGIVRLIFLSIISAMSSVAQSAPVTFEFTGRVSDEFLFYGNMVQGGFSYPEWNGKSISGQFVVDVEGLTSSPANSPYYRHYVTSLYHNADDWLSFTLTNPDGKTYSFPGDYAFADDIDPFSLDYVNSTHAWLDNLPEGKGNKFSVSRNVLNPDLQLKRFIYLSLESRAPNPLGLINGLDFETLSIDAQYANWINHGLVNYATADGVKFDYHFTVDSIRRVPEPSILSLLLAGLMLLVVSRRLRQLN